MCEAHAIPAAGRQSVSWFATLILVLLALLAGGGPTVRGGDSDAALVELNRLPWFLGRDYFVLRSGRAQMIVQADQADLGPAFTYLLFDAQDARQSVTKTNALNFVPGTGFGASALEVELGGFGFTALGHRTQTGWDVLAGTTPSVRATWWAGGVQVTERLVALAGAGAGAFYRLIELEGKHLVGPETVMLRLRLPPGETEAEGACLLQAGKRGRLALVALGTNALVAADLAGAGAALAIGPLTVKPRARITIPTLLVVGIPGGEAEASRARVRTFARTAPADMLRETEAAWRRASRVQTADRVVADMFDKARFGLPGMIADDGTMDAGIFEYGAQWVRDTSNTALGAIHAGHFEVARHALERMLTQMVSRDGVTMIAGAFEKPDLEQFDQMGELLHVLKAYRDWTGDDSLLRQHRDLLLALIERPLQPQFRDETGLVHNRREFWERTFRDAYELAYQTYVILGLREAADLAPVLGAPDRAPRWRAEAERMVRAMLHHPTRALVHQGRLIKRRDVTGEVADDPAGFKGFAPDVPLNTEQHHRLLPDASMALPIALRVVDPRSDCARRTLDQLEELWNTRWSDGGYDRYHTSVQPDQPGPWPFATTFILRAQHEAGLWDRSRRSLEWLNTSAGGRAGTWFEEVPSIRSLSKSCGLVCWTSGEVALFIVRHYLGVRFEGETLVVRPAVYPGSPPVQADLRFRDARLQLTIDSHGRLRAARVNDQPVKPDRTGTLRWTPKETMGL
jgi:hypothetical protein